MTVHLRWGEPSSSLQIELVISNFIRSCAHLERYPGKVKGQALTLVDRERPGQLEGHLQQSRLKPCLIDLLITLTLLTGMDLECNCLCTTLIEVIESSQMQNVRDKNQ